MYDEMDIDVMIGISDDELPTGLEIPVIVKEAKEEVKEESKIEESKVEESKKESKIESKKESKIEEAKAESELEEIKTEDSKVEELNLDDILADFGVQQVAEPEPEIKTELKTELKVKAKEYTAPDPESVRAPEPVPVEKRHRGITEVLVGLVKRA